MGRASALPPACAATVIVAHLEPAVRTQRARRLAYAVVALEVAIVVGFAIAYRPFDLNIYLWGGHAVTEGSRLYLVQAHANWFTYPPFAAALFVPLAGLPTVVVVLAWELATVAASARSMSSCSRWC
jgi:hypothetical protein